MKKANIKAIALAIDKIEEAMECKDMSCPSDIGVVQEQCRLIRSILLTS